MKTILVILRPLLVLVLSATPFSMQAEDVLAGSMDTSFNAPNLNSGVSAAIIQSSGKIVLGGTFSYVGTVAHFGLLRINANGSVDASFTAQARGTLTFGASSVFHMMPWPGGRMLLHGNFNYIDLVPRTNFAVLEASGAVVPGFLPPSRISGRCPTCPIAAQTDSQALIGILDLPGIVRLKSNGTVDPTFFPTNLLFGSAIALQTNGQIVVAGGFPPDGTIRVVRLNGDGSADGSFHTPLMGPQLGFPEVTALAVQSDGKILVSGGFTSVDGLTRVGLARLRADGMVDTDFVPGPGGIGTAFGNAVGPVAVITLQKNGKILIGGDFSSYGGVARSGLARLNTDGSLDTGFDIGAGFQEGTGAPSSRSPGGVNGVAETAEGKLLVWGSFNFVDGQRHNFLVRLHGISTGRVPPEIIRQPGSQAVALGSNATLRVEASGTVPLHYQWHFNGNALPGKTNSTLLVARAQSTNAGGYSVVVTNRFGALTSAVATLTVVVPPQITLQPANQSVNTTFSDGVVTGPTVLFTVEATGTEPLAYQWLYNGAPIATNRGRVSGAGTATLTIENAQSSDAGRYSVLVSNFAARLGSSNAVLLVNGLATPDNAPPALTDVLPASGFIRNSADVIELRGRARDQSGIAGVWVRKNGEPALLASSTNGWVNWIARVGLTAGTNVLRIQAFDKAGNPSLTQTRVVYFVVTHALTLRTNGPGSLVGLANGQPLEVGRGYSIRAIPGAGALFSNWISSAGFTSTDPLLRFLMASNLTLTANFATNPFPRLKGAYSGLFFDPVARSHTEAGFFNLALNDAGIFSGKLLLAGVNHTLGGRFDLALRAQQQLSRGPTNPPLMLDLQLRLGSDAITGSVSSAMWTSELMGYRAPFNALTQRPTNFLGRYTMLLSGGDDPAISPFGESFATLTVNNSGAVAIAGALADGTPVGQVVPLAAGGWLPLYLNLYGGKGSIFGWVKLTNDLASAVIGDLLWTKTGAVGGRFYPRGFTNTVATLGSRFVPPGTGTNVLSFSDAVVLLQSGNVTGVLTNHVVLGRMNRVTVMPPNAHRLTLTLNASSGLINGSFFNMATRSTTFIRGAVLQTQGTGGGFFLGTNQSGTVFLGPSEEFPLQSP